jgi:hypothetical protein
VSAEIVCSREDCTAPQGGPCAAGSASPQDCPNVTAAVAGPADQLERPAEPVARLLSGDEGLDADEVSKFLSSRRAKLVMPLGSKEAGKTTLVLRLYTQFLAGPVANLSFASTETLLKFEKIALPSRLEAGVDLPETIRTPFGETDRIYLHLGVAEDQCVEDMFFINLSGEYSDRVGNGHDPNTELPQLRSCDRVLICVDGAEVAGNRGRSDLVVGRTRQLLRSLAEQTTLAGAAQVALVLTKWDSVSASADAEARWEEARPNLVDLAEKLGRPTTTFAVAARKLVSDPPDDGMEALTRWLVAPNPAAPSEVSQPSPSDRAMTRFRGG